MNAMDFEYAIKKDVRNNPIVREVDEARHRALLRSTLVFGLLVVVVLFSVWQKFQLVSHGYAMETLQKQRAAEEWTRMDVLLLPPRGFAPPLPLPRSAHAATSRAAAHTASAAAVLKDESRTIIPGATVRSAANEWPTPGGPALSSRGWAGAVSRDARPGLRGSRGRCRRAARYGSSTRRPASRASPAPALHSSSRAQSPAATGRPGGAYSDGSRSGR